MRFDQLEDGDQRIGKILGALAVPLLASLLGTGIWLFFFHEPNTAWSGHVPGSGRFQSPQNSEGVAAVHNALSDLAGIIALFTTAWFCARVVFKPSKLALSALVLVVFAMLTGSCMRFNATVRDGDLDVETAGYPQFFFGDVDQVVTDNFELGPGFVAMMTIGHIISIPLLALGSWLGVRQARANRLKRAEHRPRWVHSYEERHGVSIGDDG